MWGGFQPAFCQLPPPLSPQRSEVETCRSSGSINHPFAGAERLLSALFDGVFAAFAPPTTPSAERLWRSFALWAVLRRLVIAARAFSPLTFDMRNPPARRYHGGRGSDEMRRPHDIDLAEVATPTPYRRFSSSYKHPASYSPSFSRPARRHISFHKCTATALAGRVGGVADRSDCHSG